MERGFAPILAMRTYATPKSSNMPNKVCRPFSRDWHDLPMEADGATRFSITLPLLGVGRFEAKAYFIADGNEQIVWPEGGNSILKVEPAETCAGNTMNFGCFNIEYSCYPKQIWRERRR